MYRIPNWSHFKLSIINEVVFVNENNIEMGSKFPFIFLLLRFELEFLNVGLRLYSELSPNSRKD